MTISTLNLYNLELSVSLGVPDHERAFPQTIFIDLQIRSPSLPQGCYTDRLEDTLCYATLCTLIESLVAKQSFHLIESLSYILYQGVHKVLPPHSQLALKLRKNPPISNLAISEFCIGEWL